ncbi:hypothetical protein ACOMHN_053077 [Nucella lapillus]
MESRRKLNRQGIMKRKKRRMRDRHKGNTEERSGKQEWRWRENVPQGMKSQEKAERPERKDNTKTQSTCNILEKAGEKVDLQR